MGGGRGFIKYFDQWQTYFDRFGVALWLIEITTKASYQLLTNLAKCLTPY